MPLPALETFTTRERRTIVRIPVEAFPGGFIVYCYLVLGGETPTLIDVGSGLGSSSADLLAGLEQAAALTGQAFRIDDIGQIVITHGHIDHFGGLAEIKRLTGAQVGIHELDRRVLTSYEERVIVATKDLKVFLERAGVRPERRVELMEMYGFAKRSFSSVPVDFSLDDEAVIDDMVFIHAPGHCPGQVCILIDDILLSADHILSRTSPHQAPESITAYTGLGHYLEALTRVERFARAHDVRLTLGGHEDPIADLPGRIHEIRASHARKLERALEIVRTAPEPLTIYDISKQMYPERRGYERLLALEETGAHIEYLYQHGRLSVCNLSEVEHEDNPALRYAVC
jgi:glyoxylase-like metal-dependent hydrolase (beta-lactamase superfamily II)